MSKVSIVTIANLENQPKVVAQINANFTAIQTVIDNLLSRDGTVPNSMTDDLDMNNQKIVNLPAPTTPTEPARHGDIQQYVDDAHDYADDASDSADAAAESATDADSSATDAANSLADLVSRYIGDYSTDPTVDPNGNALETGALYWNSTHNYLRVFTNDDVSDGDAVTVNGVVVGYWVTLPINTVMSMQDVDGDNISANQLLKWSASSKFVGVDATGANLGFDKTQKNVLTSSTVQAAIDEITDRTTLNRYDLSFFIEGLMSETERLITILCLHPFKITTSPTYYTYAGTAPNNDTTLYFKKNGTQFGTLSIDASDTTGTLSIPGDTQFNAGDRLELFNSATADTALRDLSISISAIRTYS